MNLKDITPVLMCGGEGRRLRPLSRKHCPKPFVKAFSTHSLFQKTLKRVGAFAAPVVLTREDLMPLVVQQAGNIEAVVEPVARNTAPALLKMCLEAKDKDAPHLFLPTDHDIQDITPLLNVLAALEYSHDLVLFGISPDHASTRYGYIGQGAVTFHEKPDKQRAQSYIDKHYLWNSGMVLATPRVILQEAELHAPALLSLVREKCYAAIKPISFDYAILEKSERITCVPVDLVWRDVGTLRSYLNYVWNMYDKSTGKTKHKPHSDDRAEGLLSKS